MPLGARTHLRSQEESVMSEYLPLLYRCNTQNRPHYHVIVGPRLDMVSNPFETKMGVDIIAKHFFKIEEGSKRMQALLEQACAESRKMYRDERGRFTRPLMPRGKLQQWEGEVMPMWRDLVLGKPGNIGFVAWTMGMCMWVPLECDFVHREGWSPDMKFHEAEKLPVRLKTWEEMGIVLETFAEQ